MGLIFLFHRFSLTTIALALLLALSISPATAHRKTAVAGPALTKLAENICKNFEDVEDHSFCINVLSTPEAKAAGEDPKALIQVVLKLAGADAEASVVETKNHMINQNLTLCLTKFESAARVFNNMLPTEVEDGDSTVSYDIKVNTDKADECDRYMMSNNISVPKINERTKCLRRFAMIGFYIALSYE